METDERSDRRERLGRRLALGVIVIAAGVLFLLGNLGYPFHVDISRWWPVLIIVFGLAKLALGSCGRKRLWGLFWTFAGTWLLLDQLGLVTLSFWRLWPVFLIVFGVSLVMRALVGPKWSGRDRGSACC